MPIEPSVFEHPRRAGRVRVFATDEKARAHLRDHLLTAPESAAWANVVPECRDLARPENARGRYRLAKALMGGDPEVFGRLYQAYVRTIMATCRAAVALDWCAEADGVEVFFATNGVLVLTRRGVNGDAVVKTSYIPGQGCAEAVGATSLDVDQAIRREAPGGMRRGRPVPREERTRARRELRWGNSERQFYRVFRPALQFIRAAHMDQPLDCRWSGGAAFNRREYALLKAKLPRCSMLNYDHWRTLADRADREQERSRDR